MTPAGDAPPDPLADATLAVRLCAADARLGGMILRGGGEARDAVVAALRDALPLGAPVRRLPVGIDDERLLGGVDLAATLATGRPVRSAGLLAEASGGVVVVPMAERLGDATAARIAAALDEGAAFVVVALDDGIDADERPPAALAERLAFSVDLSTLPSRHPELIDADGVAQDPLGPSSRFFPPASGGKARISNRTAATPFRHAGPVPASTVPQINTPVMSPDGGPRHKAGVTDGGGASRELRDGLAQISNDGDDGAAIEALVAAGLALGIDSARAALFAWRAARAAARIAGRAGVADEDVALAARLVLGHRATRMPVAAEEEPAPPEPPPPASDEDLGDGEERPDPGALDDLVLAAAMAALPADLLARIAAGRGRGAARASGAGERRTSSLRGRPLAARAGIPGGGRRLALIDTLRAAAPWQRLRGGGAGRVRVRRDDLRVRRFETRAPALTVVAVDASGSAALARLAEAKGAVELLLAEAYVKRAEVALVAFRGTSAELLLPPTRSLARARRSLAELPGGGGTPLAAGLDAARALAESGRARGRTPFVVLLTDGRANVAADGVADRARAEADATAAATAIGQAGIAAAFVDISARPRPEGAALAAAMRARYLPLPRADAAAMHAAVAAARPA